MTNFFNTSKKLSPSAPLHCWDFISSQLFSLQNPPSHETLILTLKFFSNSFKWSTELNMLNHKFDALVLTDDQETIIWASPGFEKMTDYPVDYAIGKKPSFLQGKDTSYAARAQIRSKIKKGKPFSSQLINYKKKGEPYLCEINIFPMEGPNGKTTHFLALENEL